MSDHPIYEFAKLIISGAVGGYFAIHTESHKNRRKFRNQIGRLLARLEKHPAIGFEIHHHQTISFVRREVMVLEEDVWWWKRQCFLQCLRQYEALDVGQFGTGQKPLGSDVLGWAEQFKDFKSANHALLRRLIRLTKLF